MILKDRKYRGLPIDIPTTESLKQVREEEEEELGRNWGGVGWRSMTLTIEDESWLWRL